MSSEVPEGWLVKPLGEIADLIMGQSPPSSAVTDGGEGLPFIQGNAEFGARHPAPRFVVSTTPKVVKKGDILISVRAPVGEVNIAEAPLCIGRGVAGIRAKDCDPDFLFYAVGSLSPTFARLSQGSIFDAINGKELRSIEVLLPPLDEQRRIAEVLRSVDEAIKKAELVASGAKSARMALLADLFHRADWEPQRELPSGWQTPLLDAVAKRGSGHTPNKKFSTYWDGDVKWISLQDTKRLDRVYIADTAATITSEGMANSSAVLHPANTVVVSRDATVGRSAIMMSDMAVSQHFISYTCGTALAPLYLYYWLQRMKPVFERIGAGSTIKTIGLPFFKGLKIAMPDRAEQDRVANLLWHTDNQVFASEATITRLRLVKAAVSSDLLSGRVRVPA